MESTSLHSQDTARCLWGPQHPGGWDESLSNRAGLCGEGGGRRGGRRWSAPLGAAGGGEVSIHLKRHTYLEGPVGSGKDMGVGGPERNMAHIPSPTWPGGPAEALHLVLHLPRPPLLTEEEETSWMGWDPQGTDIRSYWQSPKHSAQGSLQRPQA